MNSDPQKSAQPCGCDEGASYVCEQHRVPATNYELIDRRTMHILGKPVPPTLNTKAARKARPIYSGVMKYFPDALLAVAAISQVGNDQHNPGEPLHWARHKSTDQLDAATRHLIDHAKGIRFDDDGGRHLAKAAWRILAELQLNLEAEQARIKP